MISKFKETVLSILTDEKTDTYTQYLTCSWYTGMYKR